MSRIDDFLEMLDDYEGRESKKNESSFVLTEHDIEQIYNTFSRPQNPKIVYLYANTRDKKFMTQIVSNNLTRSPDFDDAALSSLGFARHENMDFVGIAFYTAAQDPAKFFKEGFPQKIQWVPDGVETPDLMIAIGRDGHYVKKESSDWVEGNIRK